MGLVLDFFLVGCGRICRNRVRSIGLCPHHFLNLIERNARTAASARQTVRWSRRDHRGWRPVIRGSVKEKRKSRAEYEGGEHFTQGQVHVIVFRVHFDSFRSRNSGMLFVSFRVLYVVFVFLDRCFFAFWRRGLCFISEGIWRFINSSNSGTVKAVSPCL